MKNPSPAVRKRLAMQRARRLLRERHRYASDAEQARAEKISRQRLGQILRRVR